LEQALLCTGGQLGEQAWTRYAFYELAASLSHSRETHWRHLQSELFVLLFLGERAPLSGQPVSYD
jgi:hypothetical protein